MSNSDVRLRELGGFLKARRAKLDPADVGLLDNGTRRVTGLRREEVARLAAISTDYYTRVEQGRLLASGPVLEELARVLRLDEHERAYVYELAGKPLSRTPQKPMRRINAQMRRLLDLLGETPAVVFGRHMDVLAWNRMAAALVTDFSKVPEKQRNYAWLVFKDPDVRRLYRDWEDVARLTVAYLHWDAAQNPEDPRLVELVTELSDHSDFKQWWEDRLVEAKGEGTKTLRHPVVGEITLDWDTLTSATATDQQLIVWTAEPGSPAYDALQILASWAAEHLPAGGSEAPIKVVGGDTPQP
ncbi:helix-turn-helix transcriptional regulator [Streptomyces sp. NPDC046942]|uniref:helix-turn-helix transcriptional regulator n=1 Tax=Streptomyces sp. NPDC046942 TaxID=3155137 RepID=UPI0033E38829